MVNLYRDQLAIERYQHVGSDDHVPVKFGPKRTDPQQEGCVFRVSHAERCAVGVSRPSCKHNVYLL